MDESEKSSNELVKALQYKRRRSVSLTSGKGQKAPALNPFVNETRCLTTYEYFKLVVCGVLLFPLRALSLVLLILFSYPFAKIALLGLSRKELQERPLVGWRKLMLLELRWACRLLLHCLGFHWVRTKGHPSCEAPIVVCNHPSIVEHFWLVHVFSPSVVAKDSLAKLPVLGTFLKAFQLIFVSRDSPTSRKDTADTILARAKAHCEAKGVNTWPQVMLFPEGTNSSSRGIISFRLGAFTPGLPIQPVVVRYPFKYHDVSASDPALSTLWLLFRTMCQFYNRMEVQYLPVYYPSEEEKSDPKLFANNVRQVMARALGVPTTEHAYEDVMLQGEAVKKHFPAPMVLLEAGRIHEAFDFVDLSRANLLKYFEKFMEMDADHSGEITYPEFVQVLGLPDTAYTQNLFHLLDVDESGSIDFREFITGLAMLDKSTSEETLRFVFDIFDVNKDGKIYRNQLGSILRTAFPALTEQQIDDLFARVDVKGYGAITYDEFVEFAGKNPEYVRLLLDVRKDRQKQEKQQAQAASTLQAKKND